MRDGTLLRDELRRVGLTDDDLFAHLRERGVLSLRGVQLVLYESRGELTVVHDGHGADDLVRAALDAPR